MPRFKEGDEVRIKRDYDILRTANIWKKKADNIIGKKGVITAIVLGSWTNDENLEAVHYYVDELSLWFPEEVLMFPDLAIQLKEGLISAKEYTELKRRELECN